MDELLHMLEKHDILKYANEFQQHGITSLAAFATLDEETLSAWGLKLGARKKILQIVSDFHIVKTKSTSKIASPTDESSRKFKNTGIERTKLFIHA
ncbi:MAG: hypothetical protein ACK4RX_01610 [Chitinophagaceae bacterium]